MTPDKLAELEGLLEKATKGPWFTGSMNDCVFIIDRSPRGNTDYAPSGGNPETSVIAKVGPSRLDEANAALIVWLVNNAPALLRSSSEREARLREALEELANTLNDAKDIPVNAAIAKAYANARAALNPSPSVKGKATE